jgi:hypothetical protein
MNKETSYGISTGSNTAYFRALTDYYRGVRSSKPRPSVNMSIAQIDNLNEQARIWAMLHK